MVRKPKQKKEKKDVKLPKNLKCPLCKTPGLLTGYIDDHFNMEVTCSNEECKWSAWWVDNQRDLVSRVIKLRYTSFEARKKILALLDDEAYTKEELFWHFDGHVYEEVFEFAYNKLIKDKIIEEQ